MLRHSAVASLLVLAGACERKASSPPVDSAVVAATPVAAAIATARARSGWNPAVGPTLLIPGSSVDEAIAFFPFADDTLDQEALDSVSATGGTATLFGRGGTRFSARLGTVPGATESVCERWALRDLRPQGNGATWAVGFVDATVTPVALDSVNALSPRDSAALAAEASRLASTVTAPTGPSFQGLRFSAHDVRRFEAAPGVQAIAAHLIRYVNQEANAQEEQTLLIAERDSGVTTGPYRLVYAERSFGREEKVVTPEVLAGIRIGSSKQPTLIVARDGESGVMYAFLERTGPRKWVVRWTSGAVQCS